MLLVQVFGAVPCSNKMLCSIAFQNAVDVPPEHEYQHVLLTTQALVEEIDLFRWSV